MFSRLYVLIQENLANFNIEGIYTVDEINKRKTYLNNIYPFNKYIIRGPFTINSNIQNNIFKTHNTNQFMTLNNTFNQNTNQFMTPNNTFNQNTNQYSFQNNNYFKKSQFKINDMNMDIE